jgi:hypothetical protein
MFIANFFQPFDSGSPWKLGQEGKGACPCNLIFTLPHSLIYFVSRIIIIIIFKVFLFKNILK